MLCKKWENLLLTRCCLLEIPESKVFDVFCIYIWRIRKILKQFKKCQDLRKIWLDLKNLILKEWYSFYWGGKIEFLTNKLLAPVFYFVDVDQHSQCSCRLFVSSWFSRNFHQIRHCWGYFFTWIFPFLSFSGGAYSYCKITFLKHL